MTFCLILRVLSLWSGLSRPELREACTEMSSDNGRFA